MKAISIQTPAFPTDCEWMNGMTLRDYFAAAALQGMLAYSHVNPMHGNYHENCTSAQVAEAAYALANAMLAERAKDF